MAVNDIKPLGVPGLNTPPTYPDGWLRDDRNTSSATATVKAGEPLKASGTSSQFCILLVDADLTIGTDQTFIGVAQAESTETAANDGKVEVFVPLPSATYSVRALTGSLVDTESEINALRGEYHVMDLTSGVFTMDTAAGDGANNAFLIVGGDVSERSLWFMVRSDATVFGRARV